MSESDKISGAPRYRRRGPLPVAQDVTSLLQHHLKARGFSQIELVTRWPEIAGGNLSAHCFPSKLSAASAGGATLTLVANDRAALELQHQAPKLIDKINTYFGRTLVSKIKVVAGDVAKPVVTRPGPRPLSVREETELRAWTSSVEDPILRDALTRLGRNALGESRKSAILKR